MHFFLPSSHPEVKISLVWAWLLLPSQKYLLVLNYPRDSPWQRVTDTSVTAESGLHSRRADNLWVLSMVTGQDAVKNTILGTWHQTWESLLDPGVCVCPWWMVLLLFPSRMSCLELPPPHTLGLNVQIHWARVLNLQVPFLVVFRPSSHGDYVKYIVSKIQFLLQKQETRLVNGNAKNHVINMHINYNLQYHSAGGIKMDICILKSWSGFCQIWVVLTLAEASAERPVDWETR